MKEKNNFRKGLEKVLASSIIFLGSLVGSVNAEKIKINPDGIPAGSGNYFTNIL